MVKQTVPYGCALWSVMRHIIEQHNGNARIVVQKCDSVDVHEKVHMSILEMDRAYIIEIDRGSLPSKDDIRENGCACFEELRERKGQE